MGCHETTSLECVPSIVNQRFQATYDRFFGQPHGFSALPAVLRETFGPTHAAIVEVGASFGEPPAADRGLRVGGSRGGALLALPLAEDEEATGGQEEAGGGSDLTDQTATWQSLRRSEDWLQWQEKGARQHRLAPERLRSHTPDAEPHSAAGRLPGRSSEDATWHSVGWNGQSSHVWGGEACPEVAGDSEFAAWAWGRNGRQWAAAARDERDGGGSHKLERAKQPMTSQHFCHDLEIGSTQMFVSLRLAGSGSAQRWTGSDGVPCRRRKRKGGSQWWQALKESFATEESGDGRREHGREQQLGSLGPSDAKARSTPAHAAGYPPIRGASCGQSGEEEQGFLRRLNAAEGSAGSHQPSEPAFEEKCFMEHPGSRGLKRTCGADWDEPGKKRGAGTHELERQGEAGKRAGMGGVEEVSGHCIGDLEEPDHGHAPDATSARIPLPAGEGGVAQGEGTGYEQQHRGKQGGQAGEQGIGSGGAHVGLPSRQVPAHARTPEEEPFGGLNTAAPPVFKPFEGEERRESSHCTPAGQKGACKIRWKGRRSVQRVWTLIGRAIGREMVQSLLARGLDVSHRQAELRSLVRKVRKCGKRRGERGATRLGTALARALLASGGKELPVQGGRGGEERASGEESRMAGRCPCSAHQMGLEVKDCLSAKPQGEEGQDEEAGTCGWIWPREAGEGSGKAAMLERRQLGMRPSGVGWDWAHGDVSDSKTPASLASPRTDLEAAVSRGISHTCACEDRSGGVHTSSPLEPQDRNSGSGDGCTPHFQKSCMRARPTAMATSLDRNPREPATPLQANADSELPPFSSLPQQTSQVDDRREESQEDPWEEDVFPPTKWAGAFSTSRSPSTLVADRGLRHGGDAGPGRRWTGVFPGL